MDVRYIPTSLYIIPLGQLDYRGNTYESWCGFLRVIKGDHVVMRKVLNDGNLYRLIDRVVENKKQVIIGDHSPKFGGEITMCTICGDHIFKMDLHVGDALNTFLVMWWSYIK